MVFTIVAVIPVVIVEAGAIAIVLTLFFIVIQEVIAIAEVIAVILVAIIMEVTTVEEVIVVTVTGAMAMAARLMLQVYLQQDH